MDVGIASKSTSLTTLINFLKLKHIILISGSGVGCMMMKWKISVFPMCSKSVFENITYVMTQ